MDAATYGKKLRHARIRNAMTMAELGEKVGVAAAMIGTWERGKALPGPRRRQSLRQVLGLGSTTKAPAEEISGDGGGSSSVGVWLNRLRNEARVSVSELATRSGVSYQLICGIESGSIANPRQETLEKLQRALGIPIPDEVREEAKQDATVEGVGEFVDFEPQDDATLPKVAGVYVLYDVSDRPIYVGQAANVRSRIRQHRDKFWFREPIVQSGAYVEIHDGKLRNQIETILIRFLKSNAVLNKYKVDR